MLPRGTMTYAPSAKLRVLSQNVIDAARGY